MIPLRLRLEETMHFGNQYVYCVVNVVVKSTMFFCRISPSILILRAHFLVIDPWTKQLILKMIMYPEFEIR